MGQKVCIEQTLYASVAASIELPEKYTWDDVKDLFIKWDTLHLFMEDNKMFEIELNSSMDDDDVVELKRPKSIQVYSADKDGKPDFDDIIHEQD